MERNSQVIRILKIMTYLEAYPSGMTIKQMQDRLLEDGIKTSLDTVYRDIKAIEGVGAPLTKIDEKYKFEYVAEINKTIKFAPKDLIALFLAQESMKHFDGSPFFEDLNQFFLKLRTLLNIKDFDALEEYKLATGFQYRATWQTGISQELLDTVYAACIENHLLELDYKSNYEETATYKKRVLGPEKIYFADSSIYLIAKDMKDGTIKTYNLHRAQSAMMLETAYNPENMNLENYFKNSFGMLNVGEPMEVSLFITQPLASYVAERKWHASQSIVRTPDGIHFKMTVKVNDEVARWILSLSPCCEVLSPVSLQTRVLELVNLTINKYTKKKSA